MEWKVYHHHHYYSCCNLRSVTLYNDDDDEKIGHSINHGKSSGVSLPAPSSSPSDDLDFVMDPDDARAFLSRLVVVDINRPRPRAPAARPRRRRGGAGSPPATAASIAALPTVEVAEPAAVCAICKDDLPLASEARKLPCAHLYHSLCIVTWLQMHNSCPVCRFRIPDDEAAPPTTRITIRFTTTTRRRARVGQ